MAKSIDQIKAELAAKRQPSAVAVPSENGQGSAPAPREPSMVERAAATPRKRVPTSLIPNAGERVIPVPRTGTAQDIHRAPPHSVEAEQGVLGSMLLSPKEVIPEVVGQVGPDYFYVPSHQTIFVALVDMWDSGEAVDLITFTQRLRDMGHLETVGGPALITNLYSFVPTAANVGYYVDIVRDKYILRSLIATSTENVWRAYEEQDEVGPLLDEAESRLLSIGDDRYKTDVRSMKDNVMVAIEQIGDAYERKGGIIGIATGFSEFDRMTGGLRDSEMVVIAARPSMGKTALAMNIAEHVTVNDGKAVGVFSLEMSVDQLTQRLLCSRARVNLQKLRDGFLGERDFPSLTAAAAKLSEAKMLIDDSSGMSILELRAKARRMKSKHDICLVIVDYLQLLRSTSKRGQENRQVEVSEISAGLKNLAKEIKVPVVVLAQLNRQPEARHGGRPRLSDLRESGSIEQDADLVALLTRPEIYEEDHEVRAEMAGEAELIIAKQRNGPVGEVPLTFLKEFTRFEDRARQYSEPEQML